MKGLAYFAPAVMAGVAACGLAAGCDGGSPSPHIARLATARLALSDLQCADYCGAVLSAAVYREDSPGLPIGPPVSADCGDDLVFVSLPAGHRVFVTATLSDFTGEPLLTGDSAVVTIVAGGVVDLDVALVPVDLPVIATITPDPVVAVAGSGPVVVTLSGAGFGRAEGDWGVLLDGHELVTESWTDEAVMFSVDSTATGSALSLKRCGVATADHSVRLVATGELPVDAVLVAPGCSGRRYVAAASNSQGGALAVAVHCDDPGQGHVQRLQIGACGAELDDTWVAGLNPDTLAAANDGIWFGGATSSVVWWAEFAASASAPKSIGTLADGRWPAVLAGTQAHGVFVVGALGGLEAGDTRLYAQDGQGGFDLIPGIDSTLSIWGAEVVNDWLFAVATSAGGVGKLVGVPLEDSGPGTVVEWSLAECARPVAVSTISGDSGGLGASLAIACRDTGTMIHYLVDDGAFAEIGAAGDVDPYGMILDSRGDVALVANGASQRLSILKVWPSSEQSVLWQWDVDDFPSWLARMGGGGILAGSADGASLSVIWPYGRSAGCGP